MLSPIIFALIALLLIVFIGYNIIQQYKVKMENEQKIAINKQRAIIAEVEELLLNATKMPFSKSLLLIMQNRIRNALITMLKASPHSLPIREHLSNTDQQIENLKQNYTPPDESVLRAPQSNNEALVLLKITKKIRAILRSEHTKGKISTDMFISEEKTIELMQLKINLENSFKRIQHSQLNNQYGSANQMINKLLTVLNGIPDKDAYLLAKEKELNAIKDEIKKHLNQVSDEEVEAMKAKDKEKQNDLDVLFQDKKKW
ncbi:DNA repair ATPase [Psychromonas sp. PT13]|uniref:DNA repair ATPase n=1 Tax=Psychromonas sp. PT13 TaxID=3439547 RepID=UPI003EBE2716